MIYIMIVWTHNDEVLSGSAGINQGVIDDRLLTFFVSNDQWWPMKEFFMNLMTKENILAITV